MQNIQEGGYRVTGSLSNLSLLDQRLVEQVRGILLLLAALATGVVAIGLLAARRRSGNVEAHLDKLVLAGTGLLPFTTGASKVSVGARVLVIGRHGKLDGDFIATGEVGVGDLRVRDLERRAVLNGEGEFCLAELGLSPVPATKGVLSALEVGAVPVLEQLGEALVILGREAVQLDNCTAVALQYLHLVALGRPAPLGRPNVGVIEREGVAAADGFPAEARLCEPALAALLGQVEVDVVEALSGYFGRQSAS